MPLVWILIIGVLCSLALGVAALLHMLFPPAAAFILGVALLFVMMVSLAIGAPSYLKGRLDNHDWSALEEITGLVAGIVASAVLFGAFCRELFLADLVAFQNGTGASYSAWMGFGFDNLFEAVLLDIPALYNLHSSPIRAGSFWSASLMLLYRVAVDLVLLKTLISQVLRHRRR